MASLRDSIDAVPDIHASDRDAILKRSREYVADGYSVDKAESMAINYYAGEASKQLDSVRAQSGVGPAENTPNNASEAKAQKKFLIKTNEGDFNVSADTTEQANEKILKYLSESKSPSTSDRVAAPSAPRLKAQSEVSQPAVDPAANAAVTMKREFDNSGAQDRIKMADFVDGNGVGLGPIDSAEVFLSKFPGYLKRELLGDTRKGGSLVARAAGPAIGQRIGHMFRVPGAANIGGSIGGIAGELVGDAIDGERPTLGRVAGAGVAGFVTGKPLAAATTREVATEAVKYAANNVAAKAVETGIDQHRRPTIGETSAAVAGGVIGAVAGKALDTGSQSFAAQSVAKMDAPALKVAAEARKAGYVFLPSKIGNSAMGDLADYFGGASPNSSGLANIATLKNAKATDNLVRRYIRAAPDMPLDEENMAKLFTAAEEPYRMISDISPQADASLDIFKQANSDAKKAWKAYDRTPSPELKSFADENDKMAQLALDDMIDEARKVGMPQLIPQLNAARVELAKLHLADRAINYGDYHASAKVFATAKDFGAPLTGEADLIARMHKANPGITRDVSSVTTIGSGKLPLVGAAMRAAVLSEPFQSAILKARGPQNIQQDTLAKAVRFGIEDISRGKIDSKPSMLK